MHMTKMLLRTRAKTTVTDVVRQNFLLVFASLNVSPVHTSADPKYTWVEHELCSIGLGFGYLGRDCFCPPVTARMRTAEPPCLTNTTR